MSRVRMVGVVLRAGALAATAVLAVLSSGCTDSVDAAARDACEAEAGVGNCVERSGAWVPLGSRNGTTSTTTGRSEVSDTAPTSTDPEPTTTTAPPTTAPATTAPPPTTPLQRYADALTAIGEEVTDGLGDQFCEQSSAYSFSCDFHAVSGLLYKVTVSIQDDGSLTYNVESAMGGM